MVLGSGLLRCSCSTRASTRASTDFMNDSEQVSSGGGVGGGVGRAEAAASSWRKVRSRLVREEGGSKMPSLLQPDRPTFSKSRADSRGRFLVCCFFYWSRVLVAMRTTEFNCPCRDVVGVRIPRGAGGGAFRVNTRREDGGLGECGAEREGPLGVLGVLGGAGAVK